MAMNESYNENEKKTPEVDEENEYVYKSVMEGKAKSRSWSAASLLISCASILCCCTPWCSVVFGVLAIVFAVISRSKIGYFDGLSIAGLIIGIFGVVFGVAGFVLAYLIEYTDMFDEFMHELEQYEQELGGTEF